MRGLVLITAAAFAVLVAARAEAAAPNYIFVSGPGLARPVLLANWRENHELFLAVANAPTPEATTLQGLSGRPRLDLAHFWRWSSLPALTSPRGANQHGRFYPAYGGEPAVVLIASDGHTGTRIATAKILRILKRHGIPTRL